MNLLRTLPKVDKFITHPLLVGLNKNRLMELAKETIEQTRQGIQEAPACQQGQRDPAQPRH